MHQGKHPLRFVQYQKRTGTFKLYYTAIISAKLETEICFALHFQLYKTIHIMQLEEEFALKDVGQLLLEGPKVLGFYQLPRK